MVKNTVSAGDFTDLAADYSKHRPDYCPSVLAALIGLLDREAQSVDFADIGAGTGIWTRMVYDKGVKSVFALEPNDEMRAQGKADSKGTSIRWLNGSAEQTGLPDESFDWLTMASSFHWTNFLQATKEINRVLRKRGRFTALWNPRLLAINPLLLEIEAQLFKLRPEIKRVSSGLSGITETLTEQLWASPFFDDVIYLEGRHVIKMSPARYLGAWRSVSDLRAQLGKKKFNEFLVFVEDKIKALETIEATYLTRAWSARRKD